MCRERQNTWGQAGVDPETGDTSEYDFCVKKRDERQTGRREYHFLRVNYGE